MLNTFNEAALLTPLPHSPSMVTSSVAVETVTVLDSMSWLPRADKEQCGAFIRDKRVLVVWAYNLDNIIPTCRDFEDKLIKLVWAQRAALSSFTTTCLPYTASAVPSNVNSDDNKTPCMGDVEFEVHVFAQALAGPASGKYDS
ncbi:hypothetical protein BC835DRAFT_1425474 [Cytidiella melzeri]|nr:hypothetical protein BC835DRAFT_1425474 [Cytidiella melzeri]